MIRRQIYSVIQKSKSMLCLHIWQHTELTATETHVKSSSIINHGDCWEISGGSCRFSGSCCLARTQTNIQNNFFSSILDWSNLHVGPTHTLLFMVCKIIHASLINMNYLVTFSFKPHRKIKTSYLNINSAV